MYKILIVEDDYTIAELLKKGLSSWGFDTEYVTDFQTVAVKVAEYAPHLVLMDVTLPFFNGYHWCAEIRKRSEVPIIFISSAGDNMNIVMAVNMGGDDFIAKPFDLNVVVAKIQALLRRTYSFQNQVNTLEYQDVILNLGDASISYRDEKMDLTKNEFKILQLLFENRGKAVSRDAIRALRNCQIQNPGREQPQLCSPQSRSPQRGLQFLCARLYRIFPVHQ